MTSTAIQFTARVRSVSQPEKGQPPLPGVKNIIAVGAGKGDYCMFLGRMVAEKGAHRAVVAAKEAGIPILLAGKMREPWETAYFERDIEPLLGDGVEYLGEVPYEEKLRLLSDAKATLFPIRWDEPFGLVMVEAMACGTPVVATRRGAVPEVVAHGRTGFVSDDHASLVAALGRVGHWAEQATSAGLVSIHFTNAVSKNAMVAPHGGTEARERRPLQGTPPVRECG